MAPTAAASNDPSKMTKSALLRSYASMIAEKEELAKKCGKFQKKYRRAKKALGTSHDASGSANQELILYPSGQTPGRGDFNLSEDLSKKSNVTKEEYNTFIASIHQAIAASGIPSTSTWRAVPAGPLADVLDIVRERFPWLAEYDADWPATSIMKQYLKNCRSQARRKARKAGRVRAAAAATATPDV